MNTLFGFQHYGARVGAESTGSIVSSTDARATALNGGIGAWAAALGAKARVTDTAFMASWKSWYTDWLAFRTTYSVLPDLAKDTETVRRDAIDYQKALFVWESRFEQQKIGKDTMAPEEKRGGSWFPTWAWIPVIGAAAYGVWRFVIKGRY